MSTSPSTPARRFRLVPFLIGVAMLVVILWIAGPDRIKAAVEADPWWIAVAAANTVALTIVSTYRWGYITNALGGRKVLGWRQYWATLMSSRAIGLVLPRAASDLGVRYVAVTRIGRMEPEAAAVSVALDQLFDMALLVCWMVPSLLLLGSVGGAWSIALLVVAAVLSVFLMLRMGSFARRLARLMIRISTPLGKGKGRIGRFFRHRAEGFDALADYEHLSRRQALDLSVVTYARFFLNAMMFWLVSQSLGLGIGLDTFILAGAGVQLSLILAVTPGGLGIMDLGWVGLLALAGADPEVAAAFVVGQRAFQYVIFPVLAGISYLVAAVNRRRMPEDGVADTATAPSGDPGPSTEGLES